MKDYLVSPKFWRGVCLLLITSTHLLFIIKEVQLSGSKATIGTYYEVVQEYSLLLGSLVNHSTQYKTQTLDWFYGLDSALYVQLGLSLNPLLALRDSLVLEV